MFPPLVAPCGTNAHRLIMNATVRPINNAYRILHCIHRNKCKFSTITLPLLSRHNMRRLETMYDFV